MTEKIIIVGPASQTIATKVAKIMNTKAISTEAKVFPDGECYIRLEIEDENVIKGKEVIIIQSTGANAQGNQNQRFMELFMMISAVKRIGAEKIKLVIPYFGYARQDKVFRPGEAIFAQDLCRMIENAGISELFVIDMHAPEVFNVLKIPWHNLDPMEALANEIKKFDLKDPAVICPDKGAYERSRDFAKFLGPNVPVEQFNKKRDVKTGEIKMEGELKVKDKDVIIADDIIATGGTMASAIGIAKKTGARSIYAVGTHALLIKNAVYTLLSAGTDKIVSTDTVDSPSYVVSMAEVVAKALK